MSATGISVGILAGGGGTRFGGADKGWLEYRGEHFFDCVAAKLRPHAGQLLVSANHNMTRYAAGADRVLEDAAGAGPMAGIYALWQAAQHPVLIVAPVDAIGLPEDFVPRMLAALDVAPMAVAATAGDTHYACFACRRDRVATPAATGAIRHWLGGQDHDVVALPTGTVLSVNTPEELAALEHCQ